MPSTNSPRDCPPRWATPRTDRHTLGPAVAAVAGEWGHDLMPWQRQVLDVALEVDDAGQLVYREVIVTVPRQSGKSSLILPLALHRCVAWGGAQRVVYAAQDRQSAAKKLLEDWFPLYDDSPFGKLGKTYRSNGGEKVAWHNGSYLEVAATTETSMHGTTLDLAIVDEAFSLHDHRLEQAFKPAMMTRPSHQLWIVSTAGTGDSIYLNEKVDRGRAVVQAGETEGVAFFEWSADDDADPSDPETWWSCMPALGHTVDVATVKSHYLTTDSAEFTRAYLNRWTSTRALPPIDLGAWQATADPECVPAGRLVLGLDIAPNRQQGSLAVCDGTNLELLRAGVSVDELATAARDIYDRHDDIDALWLDPAGPAGSLIPDLEAAGVSVYTVTAREMGQACAAFHDAVVGHQLKHRADTRLSAALGAAEKRSLGDLWLWNRKSTTSDITPMVAATLAHHGSRVPAGDAKPGPVFAF